MKFIKNLKDKIIFYYNLLVKNPKRFFNHYLERIFDEITKFFYKLISAFIDNDEIRKWFSLKLSKSRHRSLEITTQIGCAMMCDYCPQTLINIKRNEHDLKRFLELKDFKKILTKIPKNTKIHWTGYSEPLLHKDFPEFVSLANKEGFLQEISTTMHGKKSSQEFIYNTNMFDYVSFHLPDDKNLMKLKVTEEYIENLEKAIRHQSRILSTNSFDIKIIGNAPHNKIKILIQKLINEEVINKRIVNISNFISSRNNSIKQDNKEYQFYSHFKSQRKKKLFYCAHKRLNSGVLMPSGEINICCNDYSIGFSIGNLLSNNLEDLQMHNKLLNETDFLNGNMNVCNKCEYFKSI